MINVTKITGHQCVRGRGGAIAVLYKTHWDGHLCTTWKRELVLQAFRRHILSYWAAGPAQYQADTRQYQHLRVSEAAREMSRTKSRTPLPRLIRSYRARFLSAAPPIGASI